jgi:hypothetical protein
MAPGLGFSNPKSAQDLSIVAFEETIAVMWFIEIWSRPSEALSAAENSPWQMGGAVVVGDRVEAGQLLSRIELVKTMVDIVADKTYECPATFLRGSSKM